MGSSLNDQLGTLHVVTGLVTGSAGTLAAITSNDGSLSLVRDNTGKFTITFGDAFLSAPGVIVNVVDATYAATDGVHAAMLTALSTAAVSVDIAKGGGSAADGALVDMDFRFVIIGSRNN